MKQIAGENPMADSVVIWPNLVAHFSTQFGYLNDSALAVATRCLQPRAAATAVAGTDATSTAKSSSSSADSKSASATVKSSADAGRGGAAAASADATAAGHSKKKQKTQRKQKAPEFGLVMRDQPVLASVPVKPWQLAQDLQFLASLHADGRTCSAAADCSVHPFICQLAPRPASVAAASAASKSNAAAARQSGLSAERIIASLAVTCFQGPARSQRIRGPYRDRAEQDLEEWQCFFPTRKEGRTREVQARANLERLKVPLTRLALAKLNCDLLSCRRLLSAAISGASFCTGTTRTRRKTSNSVRLGSPASCSAGRRLDSTWSASSARKSATTSAIDSLGSSFALQAAGVARGMQMDAERRGSCTRTGYAYLDARCQQLQRIGLAMALAESGACASHVNVCRVGT